MKTPMNELSNHEVLAMMYTLLAELEKKQKDFEALSKEVKKRGLI